MNVIELMNAEPITGPAGEDAVKGFVKRTPLSETLIRRGCHFEGFDKMGKMILDQEVVSDPETEERMKEMFQTESLPLPIVSLALTGDPFEVGEAVGRAVDGAVVEALVTKPERGTMVYDPTNLSPIGVVDAMIKVMRDGGYYGPFAALFGGEYEGQIDAIRQVLLTVGDVRHPEDKVIPDVLFVEQLPRDAVVLVQTTPEVVRMIVAMRPKVVKMEEGLRVAAIMTPQVRHSYDGKCGVCVATKG